MSRVVASDGVSLSRARSSTSPSNLAPSVTGSAGTLCSRSSLSAVAIDVFGVIAGTDVIIQLPAQFDRRSTTTGHLLGLEPWDSGSQSRNTGREHQATGLAPGRAFPVTYRTHPLAGTQLTCYDCIGGYTVTYTV